MQRNPISSMLQENFVLILFSLGVLTGFYNLIALNLSFTVAFISAFLLWNVGIQGMLAGIMHWYPPAADKVAKSIGWAVGTGFQREVGAANAAFGFLGLLSYFAGPEFWKATIIGWSLMLFVMGMAHLADLRKNRNMSPMNSGAILYFDLFMPVIMISLLLLWKAGW